MLRATQTVETQAKRRQRRTILANAIKTAFCDTVAKNGKALFVSEELTHGKFKSDGFISLAKEISREPKIDPEAWLLAITLMWVYNKRSYWGRKEYKLHSLQRKGIPTSLK